MFDRRYDRKLGIGCYCGRGESFALPGAEETFAPDLPLEPKHIEIRLRFDLLGASVAGAVATDVVANREGARTIALDAVAFEEVVVEAGGGEELAWRYDGKRITATWARPFRLGERRSLAVKYRASDPVSGMLFSRPEEHYPARPFFVATDHETERARYWLPCVDYPSVRTTFDFHLTAPKDMTILANGALVREAGNADGTKTAHWQLDFPSPSYLCCIAIGRFVRVDDGEVDGCPISYFTVPPFTAEHLRRTFGGTPKLLRWLEQRIGVKFPFQKYFQIAVPEIGGAMENTTLVTWDDIMILDETWQRDIGDRVASVNVHELAHGYFGNAVVCRHFEHSWLKESWATYIETVWLEENAAKEEAEYDLVVNAEAYFDEVKNRYARPIVTRRYDSSWNLFDRHLYPGGAWRIHMIRRRIGDGPFWGAVEDYVKTFSRGVVETDDLRRVFEKHSGLSLTQFFEEWIYRPGHPKLKVAFQHDREREEGIFTIEQTQGSERQGIELFHFDLEVAFEDERGWHVESVAIADARHRLAVAMPYAPRMVCLDPGQKALFALDFNPGDDLLRAALRTTRGVAVRIWAARELIRTGRRKNLRAVVDALEKESFWGVRAAAAAELGEALSAEAIEPLALLLRRERDPRVLAALAVSSGRARDPRLREALGEILRRGDLSYLVRASALESLGAQGDEADIATLEEAARDGGLHCIVRNGALAGLGRLRSARAHAQLAARIAYGAEPDAARPAAVGALGASAATASRELRERAIETLIDLTRDRRPRVRMRAAEALADLDAGSAIPALEALKSAQPAQDHPLIERRIARLRAGIAGEEIPALRKRCEEIDARYRKLEERLQNLEAKR